MTGMSFSGTAHLAAFTLKGAPAPTAQTEAPDKQQLMAIIASLQEDVALLNPAAASSGDGTQGNLFDSMQGKSLQGKADSAMFSGEGNDIQSHKKIRDFLDKHYAFLDNSPANHSQRQGRQYLDYIERSLEGVAKDYFAALTLAERPATRDEFEEMLRGRLEPRNPREGIMANLRQLTCRNYSNYLAAFNRLTGELQTTTTARNPIDERERCAAISATYWFPMPRSAIYEGRIVIFYSLIALRMGQGVWCSSQCGRQARQPEKAKTFIHAPKSA